MTWDNVLNILSILVTLAVTIVPTLLALHRQNVKRAWLTDQSLARIERRLKKQDKRGRRVEKRVERLEKMANVPSNA